MRPRVLTAVLAGLALAQGACGGLTTGADTFTCGHMRETTGAFRQQASVLVAREGLRADRLSREEVVLDAEFQIRRACDGAADGDQPYHRVAGSSSAGFVSPGTGR